LPSAFAQSTGATLTAADVIAAIKAHLKVEWNASTYRDTVKIGAPQTVVKGIASCFMDTFDVLKKAHAQGLNLVITHEPTFWTDSDMIDPIKSDPLYLEKQRFGEANGMVVFRLHDHWHRFSPEPMVEGRKALLHWQTDPAPPLLYRVPPTRLGELARQVASRLYSRSVRTVGDPDLVVTSVAYGSHSLGGNITGLERADVVLASEVREWETVEYVRDVIATGAKKGLILISHEAGEEEGMKVFADWMRTVTPSLRSVFISTDDRLYLV
jgi:putative NIF3 family GTP cyclohydrolase 1 type 2